MQKSLLAGLGLSVLADFSNPKSVEPPATQTPHTRTEQQPLATPEIAATPIAQARSEPPVWVEPAPVTAPLAIPATPAKRKAGRPRIQAECPLTGREKAARYRQKHKALAAKAKTGGVDAVSLSHKDLCLAVARMLNRREDLELRQTGYPLVKELQRRLKSL